MIDKMCFVGYCLEKPEYIYFILPAFVLLALITFITFVRFKKPEEKKIFVKERRIDRIIFIVLRSLMVLALLIAIASPHKVKETTTEGNPSLTILADNSTSFDIFDGTIARRLKNEMEEYFPVTLKYIAYGERSAIGDGILQNAEGDDNILVISDGNNNYGRDLGDVILFSSLLNTTVHTVKLAPLKKDVSVVIDGPSQVIQQTENTFKVRVNNVGNVPYTLEIFVDGNQVSVNNEGEFTWRFSLGYHKITAKLIVGKDDHFENNNMYYKSVKALPRPEILFVTENGGPLEKALGKVYVIDVQDSIPDQLEGYDAVILNNINVNKISDSKVDMLAEYLSEKGKGLIVVGGENSFNKGNYKASYFEGILPAQVGMGKRAEGGNVNIVMVIDISESTGFGFSETSDSSKIDVEKALAINILNDIALDDKVAVVAFNHLAYVVKQLDKLSLGLTELPSKIRSLKDTGGTLVYAGLFKAVSLLDRVQGSKNIIIISDGITQQPQDAINLARSAAERGIRTYTVGVGESTEEEFMKNLALAGGGLYFKPSQAQRLKLLFGEPEEEVGEDSMQLILVDDSHWITKGDMKLQAKLSGYNFVIPRSSGRKLVATDGDRPIIVSGRFGLGRIVVMATDDGSKWSGQLFNKENSKLITRMANWAIGDFTKDNEFDVRIQDTTLGKATDVNVISDKMPDEKGLEFAKVGTGLYSAKFRPEKEGFYQLLEATVGVSYNDEYEMIGMNPQLEELVTISGGYVFDPNEVEKIRDAIISMSKRVKVESINLRWPFVIAALIIFLLDILVRRIRENRSIFN